MSYRSCYSLYSHIYPELFDQRSPCFSCKAVSIDCQSPSGPTASSGRCRTQPRASSHPTSDQTTSISRTLRPGCLVKQCAPLFSAVNTKSPSRSAQSRTSSTPKTSSSRQHIPHYAEGTLTLLRLDDQSLTASSDLHVYRGIEPAGTGFIMGHEVTGEVVAVGESVKTVQKGDLVVSAFTTSWYASTPGGT